MMARNSAPPGRPPIISAVGSIGANTQLAFSATNCAGSNQRAREWPAFQLFTSVDSRRKRRTLVPMRARHASIPHVAPGCICGISSGLLQQAAG